MSVSYFVFYKGEAVDPAAFVERYRSIHVPILQRWPGVERVVLHTPVIAVDPKTISHGEFAMIAEIVFDDADALAAALQSDERHEARLDFGMFPPFHGDISHQPMQAETFQPVRGPRSTKGSGIGEPS